MVSEKSRASKIKISSRHLMESLNIGSADVLIPDLLDLMRHGTSRCLDSLVQAMDIHYRAGVTQTPVRISWNMRSNDCIVSLH